MSKNTEMRKVERLSDSGWLECKFVELKKGDVFRLTDPDGTPVADIIHSHESIADSDTYVNKWGIEEIKCHNWGAGE